MTDASVIQATYADWKTVKGRKVLQLVFELPLEQQADVLKTLGAPTTETAQWYVIAKMTPPSQAKKTGEGEAEAAKTTNRAEKVGKPFREKSRAWQAGALCARPDFQGWIREKHKEALDFDLWPAHQNEDPENVAAIALKRILSIASRRELDENPQAGAEWDRLVDTYEVETKWGRS